jgi:hypothetical protein
VFYLPHSVPGTQRTAVIPKTLQPAWNLTAAPLCFPLTNTGWKTLCQKHALVLHVEVWDQDVVTDDWMGYGNIYLAPGVHRYTLPITETTKTYERPGGAIDLLIEFDTVRPLCPLPPLASAAALSSSACLHTPCFAA